MNYFEKSKNNYKCFLRIWNGTGEGARSGNTEREREVGAWGTV